VTELRHALRVFGLSDVGNRYELCGRLESALQARKAAASGSVAALAEKVGGRARALSRPDLPGPFLDQPRSLTGGGRRSVPGGGGGGGLSGGPTTRGGAGGCSSGALGS
jgi:hypothetical protein